MVIFGLCFYDVVDSYCIYLFLRFTKITKAIKKTQRGKQHNKSNKNAFAPNRQRGPSALGEAPRQIEGSERGWPARAAVAQAAPGGRRRPAGQGDEAGRLATTAAHGALSEERTQNPGTRKGARSHYFW